MSPAAARASVRLWPWWIGLGAGLTASCLLTTSLDDLAGPPLSSDGGVPDGGSGSDSGALDIVRADVSDVATEGGSADSGPDEGGNVEDAPTLDADADADADARGPVVVIGNLTGIPRGIAEHGDYVYWVQTDAGIARVPKQVEGGTSSFVHMTPNAFDVAVDDDYIYWSTGTVNEVHRKSLQAGSSSGFLFSGPGATFYLAAGTAGRIYVTGNDTVAVGPNPDGGTSVAHYPGQPGAAGIAIFGTVLYWSLNTGIVRGGEEGPGPKPAVSIFDGSPGEISGLATDGQYVYWIAVGGAVRALLLDDPSAKPREVCRTSTDAGDAESDARPDGDGGIRMTADIAVDDQWVYFTEPALQQISKCRKR